MLQVSWDAAEGIGIVGLEGSLHLLIRMLQTDEKLCLSHQHRFCHTLVPSFLGSTVERRDEEEEGPLSVGPSVAA